MPIPLRDGDRKVASEFGTLGKKLKVQIPEACWAILSWPRDTSEVVVELVETGRIRVHLASAVLPTIYAMIEERVSEYGVSPR